MRHIADVTADELADAADCARSWLDVVGNLGFSRSGTNSAAVQDQAELLGMHADIEAQPGFKRPRTPLVVVPDLADQVPVPADPADRSWMDHAACRGMDPDLFFTERGESTAEPKRVCAGCPVRLACLEHALAINEREGVWGGLSARERRYLKASRRRHAARQMAGAS